MEIITGQLKDHLQRLRVEQQKLRIKEKKAILGDSFGPRVNVIFKPGQAGQPPRRPRGRFGRIGDQMVIHI